MEKQAQVSNIPQSFAQAVSIELDNAIVSLASGNPTLAVRTMQDLQRKADYYTRKSKGGYSNQQHSNLPPEADPTDPNNY